MNILPSPYFDTSKYCGSFRHNGEIPDDGHRVSGYSYTYGEYKKKLIESPIVYGSDGGVTFVDLGITLHYKTVKKFTYHGPWDVPSYTDLERTMAYKIYLLEEQVKRLVELHALVM
jgi:hypothetical protein